MRRATIIGIIILLSFNLANAQGKRVKSKVVNATVYPTGAQIIREARINLEKGENSYIFTNLPSNIEQSSVQVNCGNATILSVSVQKNLLDSLNNNPEYQNLMSRKKELEKKVKLERAILQAIEGEKDILLSNKELKGDQGMKLEELKASMIYFRTRFEELEKSRVEKMEAINGLEEELKKIKRQLDELRGKEVNETSEILASFTADQAKESTVVIKYFTTEAGWQPLYDLRANAVTDPLTIVYKANIYQNTGEDWSRVKLAVSSSDPTANATAPELVPWFIDIVSPYYKRTIAATAYGVSRDKEELKTTNEIEEVALDEVKEAFEPIPVSVDESQTNFTFVVDIPYDVPSKNKPVTAILQKYSLAATYQYISIPKLSEYAYLLAKVIDWQQLNLMNGEANLYLENNFIGTTYLDTKAFNDTLKLSFGKDEGITVKRERVLAFKEKNVVGTKVTETRTWSISLYNSKKQEVIIYLEDQIPISSNEKLKVKVTEQTGASFNSADGKLKWEIKLPPADSKKIIFSYSVEYPKGYLVNLE